MFYNDICIYPIATSSVSYRSFPCLQNVFLFRTEEDPGVAFFDCGAILRLVTSSILVLVLVLMAINIITAVQNYPPLSTIIITITISITLFMIISINHHINYMPERCCTCRGSGHEPKQRVFCTLPSITYYHNISLYIYNYKLYIYHNYIPFVPPPLALK